MIPTPVTIRSVKDGATLDLAPKVGHADPDCFEFTLTTPIATLGGLSSTYVVGSPALFFDRLAASWRGWKGELEWKPLDNVIGMTAMCDKLGHVQLLVELKSQVFPPDWEFSYLLYLEAGSLETLARQFRQVFPLHGTRLKA